MLFLREDTVVTVQIGPFLDATDGVTAETALTIDQGDVHLSKNGGAFANKNEATACTHDAEHNGWYTCPLDATDTNTAGILILAVNEAGALPVWHEFMVMPTQAWDSLFGTDKLQVHAAEITDGLITAAAIADGAIDAATFAAGAINAAAIATGAIDADAIAADAITAAKIAANAIGASELAADAAAEIADAVWDEVLTSAAHDVAYSAGQRLRLLILSGATAQAATASTITLAATESATDDTHTQNIITIVSGTGAGQTRLIIEYVGATRVATVDRPWITQPNATSIYELLPFSAILLAAHGVAQAGGASTITLSTTALAIANSYVGCAVYIAAGTAIGQTRLITAYTADRVATVSPAWETQPDSTSTYKIIPVGRSILDTLSAAAQATIADAVWDEATSGHITAGTAGKALAQAATEAPAVGAITFVYTVTDSTTSLPIADVLVWACTDSAGANKVTSGYTDDFGQVTLYLDAGTYYLFRKKSGYSFSNPDTEVVA